MRGAVVIVALLLASGGALADDALAAARTAYANVDYEKCRSEAARALKQPGDRDARVQAHQHLGLCLAALGDTEGARESFKNMLAIDHDARLPDGLSPRFTSSFREAKGALVGQAPLQLAVESDTVDGGTRTLRVALTDTLSLVKEIAWRGEGGVLSPATRAAARLELEVPASVDVTLVLLDTGGGEILWVPLQKPGTTSADPGTTTAEEGDGSATPYIVVGAVALGVLLLGGAAALVVIALQPPTAVTLKTDVAFQK